MPASACWRRASTERWYARPLADLEHILQQLHDSEINAGVQTFYDAGMRVWIGDEANGIQAEATINRTAAARLKWPEGITAASWLHETARRLYPDSKYAKAHSTEAPKKPAKDYRGREDGGAPPPPTPSFDLQ